MDTELYADCIVKKIDDSLAVTNTLRLGVVFFFRNVLISEQGGSFDFATTLAGFDIKLPRLSFVAKELKNKTGVAQSLRATQATSTRVASGKRDSTDAPVCLQGGKTRWRVTIIRSRVGMKGGRVSLFPPWPVP
jgi:hypothetical protein